MAEQITQMDSIVACLADIHDDASVPRNVRIHIQGIMSILKEETEISIKVNKALNLLDEIANDVNLQSYTRTQIWNVMSILEKL